jgi:hypothetical protein
MLKEKLTIERRKAVLLTVDISGKHSDGNERLKEYALAWLKLTNNAREYKNMIWKIENNRNNDWVYVWCNPKSAENIKDFCNHIISSYDSTADKMNYIGKVIDEEEVEVGFPIYEYESTCDSNNPQWEEDIESSISDWMYVME